jgi:hypothetical protein
MINFRHIHMLIANFTTSTRKPGLEQIIVLQALNTVDSAPCLGEKWQAKLEREYTKKVFKFIHTAYLINDPDIANRSFPPGRVTNGQVVIYEKSP